MPPGKAGPTAAQAQVGQGKGKDPESSTEESDSEGEVPAAVSLAKNPVQVRLSATPQWPVPRSGEPVCWLVLPFRALGFGPRICFPRLIFPHTRSPVGSCPDPVFCYSRQSPWGKTPRSELPRVL